MKEGLFIPMKFLKLKELNVTEIFVLSVYRQEKDENKCCNLTNLQVADKVNISVWYLNKIKRHLKELGYIKSGGGIKVIYLGPNEDKNNKE